MEIFTIKEKDSSLSFCPERGGIITAMTIRGKDILYMDEETFLDPSKNVRGGIPILFPNAGPLDHGPYSLEQHGFARKSSLWNKTLSSKKFSERLLSDDSTMKVFPYSFSLGINGEIKENGSISITEEVSNTGNSSMPIAMGLHPYFLVPEGKKSDIVFDFEGGDIISKDIRNWSEGGTTIINNPKISDESAVLKVFIPKIGNISLDIPDRYQKIWIWSVQEKDFICIEPMMRGIGGLVDDPFLILPGQSLSCSIDIDLV
jgi:galactose mutarotase-like enzyme